MFCLKPSFAAPETTLDGSAQRGAPKRQGDGVHQPFVAADFMGLRLQRSGTPPVVPPWDKRNWPPGWVLETPRGPGIAFCCRGLPATTRQLFPMFAHSVGRGPTLLVLGVSESIHSVETIISDVLPLTRSEAIAVSRNRLTIAHYCESKLEKSRPGLFAALVQVPSKPRKVPLCDGTLLEAKVNRAFYIDSETGKAEELALDETGQTVCRYAPFPCVD